MSYWKWLGRGISHATSFKWVVPTLKHPVVEGLGGLFVFGTLASVVGLCVSVYLAIVPAVIAFLLLTHGMYRDFGKEGD